MYLLDVNVWLPLAFTTHEHHDAARAWFSSVRPGDTCNFCRLTQAAFLRLSNNPKVFSEAAVSQEDAWNLYDHFLANQNIRFPDEPPDLQIAWRKLTSNKRFSPNLWNDAYLAAFATVANLVVVTFDSGLKQFVNVKTLLL